MGASKKSWREKLADDKGFPKVLPIDSTKSKRWGAGTFVIAAPREVDQLMSRVGKGKLTTIDQLRTVLAKRHGATIACPMTTGIFAWIAAHAAAESEHHGSKRITPYCRTLKTGGELNGKYPRQLPPRRLVPMPHPRHPLEIRERLLDGIHEPIRRLWTSPMYSASLMTE